MGQLSPFRRGVVTNQIVSTILPIQFGYYLVSVSFPMRIKFSAGILVYYGIRSFPSLEICGNLARGTPQKIRGTLIIDFGNSILIRKKVKTSKKIL